MTDYLTIGLIIINLALAALFAYQLLEARKERQELVNKLVAKELDMLDRLMAKDLPEVKQARQPPNPGVVTSRRRNDQRIAEESAKFARTQG